MKRNRAYQNVPTAIILIIGLGVMIGLIIAAIVAGLLANRTDSGLLLPLLAALTAA